METIIKLSDCLKETGFSSYDLFSLTGVFGIHSRAEFIKLAKTNALKYKIYWDENYILTISVKSPKIEDLIVQIQGNKTEIYIYLFRLYPASISGNLGFKRFISQVNAAKKLDFKKITLWAYGDYAKFQKTPKWDGYIIWGKYGFTMYRKNEIAAFKNKMMNERLSHPDITDLVVSKEGTALWKYIGDDWKGEFILDQASKNMKYYTDYGERRKLL